MRGPARHDQDDTLVALRAFRHFLQEFQPSAGADPWMAFGDYLPYAIAFQLMPEGASVSPGSGSPPPAVPDS